MKYARAVRDHLCAVALSAICLALSLCLSSCSTTASTGTASSSGAEASPSADASTSADALSLWSADSAAAQELRDYVSAVTDESSADFIPVENRIAVFDMDGTILGETAPTYFSFMMLLHRVNDDATYTASDDERAAADIIQRVCIDKGATLENDDEVAIERAIGTSFAGMTAEEFSAYVNDFAATDKPGFSGMTYKESFFKPMLELVDYLNANDFTVYIVSGTNRTLVRALCDGRVNISKTHIIGSDMSFVASNQDGEDNLSYTYDSTNDRVVMGTDLLEKAIQMNKVDLIAQEIGIQPVLAFGNGSGDASMFNYTIGDNPYRAKAFVIVNDDNEREYSSSEKAASLVELAGTYGWTTISMANDWTTIYGDGVTRTSM